MNIKVPYLITIDGPAAVGKSSLSCQLAQKMGWKWLSTGVFYRGLAWLIKNQSIDLQNINSNKKKIIQLATSVEKCIRLEAKQTAFFYRAKNYTQAIYTEEVDDLASHLAKLDYVRESLLPAQRKCFTDYPTGLIAEGRDCGTVVFPRARLKIYLKAEEDIRAQRRANQRRLPNIKRVSSLQKSRDQQDLSRTLSPLICPVGATVIDTGSLDLKEMVKKVYQLALKLFPKP